MKRCNIADQKHSLGFNCAQSVLAAFADQTGLTEQQLMDLAGGFGGGTGTGELCGAVSGAVMALGLMTPVDMNDPVASKKRTQALSKEFQKRFVEKFEALRCQDLLQKQFAPDERTPAAVAMGITGHCSVMIVTAVEIIEAMLEEQNENR